MLESTLRLSFEIEKKLEPFYTGGLISLSPDLKFIFCICEHVVKIVEIETGRAIQSYGNDEDAIITVVGSNNTVFCAHRASFLIKQWNFLQESEQLVRSYRAPDNVPVTSLTIASQSPDLLASGSTSGIIRVWDTSDGYCTHQFKGSRGVVNLLQFHPNRYELFSAADDLLIKVWSLENSTLIMDLKSHMGPITGLSFFSDNVLVSCGRDKVINKWSLSKGCVLETVPVFETLEGILVYDDTVITCGDQGVLRKWRKNKVIAEQDKPTLKREFVQILKYANNRIIAVTFDHNIIIFNHDLEVERNIIGFNDEIIDIKPVKGDNFIIATNSEQIRLLNSCDFTTKILSGHTNTVLSIDTDVDSGLIVSGSKDNTAKIWRESGDSFEIATTCTGHTAAVTGVALRQLPQNHFFVSVSSDLTLKMWQINLKRPQKSSCMYTIKAHEKDINCVSVSPNDKFVATGSLDKTVKVWFANNGSLAGVLRGHCRGIWSMRFSPVDQCVLTSSGDCMLKLWKLSDYCCIRTYEGHSSSVLNCQFLNDGKQIASCCSDGLIKVWNVQTAECLTTLDAHTDKCWALLVHGERIVSGAADSLVNFWRDTTVEVRQKEIEEEKLSSEKQQALSNLLQQESYASAFRLSLTLNMPYKCLNIAEKIISLPDGILELVTVCDSLLDEDTEHLLEYVSTWNTNSKHTVKSQCVLFALLSGSQYDKISENPKFRCHLEALIPYTERHFERLSKLQQASKIIEYTWDRMKLSEI